MLNINEDQSGSHGRIERDSCVDVCELQRTAIFAEISKFGRRSEARRGQARVMAVNATDWH